VQKLGFTKFPFSQKSVKALLSQLSPIRLEERLFVDEGDSQRVLNDLQRTRLSRRRMIWLHTQPLLPPLSRLKVVSLFQSYGLFLTGVGLGGGEEPEPDHTTTRKPDSL
jgi:hypothetical protein